MAGYYPPVKFHFSVEFGFLPQGSNDARFQEVSGFDASLSVEEIKEGGENRFSHRLPGRATYPNLVLKRGMLVDSELIDWCKDAIENFIFAPTTVNIMLLNEEHEPVAGTLSFIDAWPVKWSISNYDAKSNEIVVETLELAYKYFTRI